MISMTHKERVIYFCISLLWLAFDQSSVTGKNLGHRMGGDIYQPENTLYCYKKLLAASHRSAHLQYVELDIQESRDGTPVVFHDSGSIARIVPATKRNRRIVGQLASQAKFNAVKISDLTVAQITNLQLANNARIPTLRDVLDASVRWRVQKPILIEIKSIRTDACRQNLIELVAAYRDRLAVNFLAFAKNFESSFPASRALEAPIQESGLCYLYG